MKRCYVISVLILLMLLALAFTNIVYAEEDVLFEKFGDYLPELPVVESDMSIEDRTNAFWKMIQDRSDELGQLYMDWSLVDKAWFTRVAEAYQVNVREKFVLPTDDDLSEDEVILLAKEAVTPVVDGDPDTLTLSILSFISDDRYEEPIWYVRFEMEHEVYLARNGDVLAVSSILSPTPAPNQIGFEQAEKIVKTYLLNKLRYTEDDIEKMTIAPNYYVEDALNPCDFFLYHCYPEQNDEFVSVYVNTDTGEVYKVDLPGLGNG